MRTKYFCITAAIFLLFGCTTVVNDPTVGSAIGEWDTIVKSEIHGPFTLLEIHHRKPGSFITKGDSRHKLVVYKNNVVAGQILTLLEKTIHNGKEAVFIGSGFGYPDRLIYEDNGKAIVEGRPWFADAEVGPTRPWIELPDRNGPYLSDSKQAKLFAICPNAFVSNFEKCRMAFSNRKDEKIDIQKEVVASLDGYIYGLKEYWSWTTWKGPMPPYTFILLTIDPLLVMAIPAPREIPTYCWKGPIKENCIKSSLLFGGYHYSPELPVVPDTVWFAPGYTTGLIPVPIHEKAFKFPIPGRDVTLVQESGKWKLILTD